MISSLICDFGALHGVGQPDPLAVVKVHNVATIEFTKESFTIGLAGAST